MIRRIDAPEPRVRSSRRAAVHTSAPGSVWMTRCSGAPGTRDELPMDESAMVLASGIAAFEAKEFRRAFQLLAPLAARGDAEAQFRVAVMSQNGLGGVVNEARAFSLMRDAARQEHGLAQHGLGVMYLYGECVEKDEREAADWFRRAAAQGLAGAMMTLGMMYEQGLGVERDAEQAKQLYARAESSNAS